MVEAAKSPNVIVKYLPVYFVLLGLAGLEVFLAYQHFSTETLLILLLALALCGGALAVMYFMHLHDERRSLFLTLIPAVIFVLLMMNMLWSDSFRLLHLKPFAH
jgi:heme/copper-type cytochrome/quinol oxidase subunit 4